MKCPKCKYVSHDYLESCRKCGSDLVAFKQDLGLLVHQPGVLDLSLVLGETGADDFFASTAEEVMIHTEAETGAEPSEVGEAGEILPELTLPENITIEDVTLPGHLRLELDASELMANWSSSTLDDMWLDDPPGDMSPRSTTLQNEADDSAELQLDLDAFEIDDDTHT